MSCRFLRQQNSAIPLRPAHPERFRLSASGEKRKSEIPVFSTSFRNRNDSGVLIGLRGKNSPCHACFCASKIPVSRYALRIPRDSGSPLPVKSVKYEQENCHPGLRAGISLFFYSEVVRNDSDLGAKNSPCHAGFCTSKIPLSRCAMHIPRDSGSPLPVKSIKYEQEIGVYRFRIGVRNDKGALVQNRHAPARMSRWISLFCQLDRPTALRR
jgi:hypothetical protein